MWERERCPVEAGRNLQGLAEVAAEWVIPRLCVSEGLDIVAVGLRAPEALQPEHDAVITRAARAGAGTIIRGGVARGEPGEGQGADRVWQIWAAAALDDLLDGMSRTEFMLRFTISHPDLHSTIVGTLNPVHLAENLAAVERGPLPADLVAEVKRRVAAAAG